MDAVMRPIEFRGKRKDNGEWVYGLYYAEPFYDCEDVYIEHVHIIINEQGDKYEVIPESVGQFTGLYDSTTFEELTEQEQKQNKKEEWKGRKIWEKDVVKSFEWHNHSYFVKFVHGRFNVPFDCNYKVIGNTIDNPDILEE